MADDEVLWQAVVGLVKKDRARLLRDYLGGGSFHCILKVLSYSVLK